MMRILDNKKKQACFTILSVLGIIIVYFTILFFLKPDMILDKNITKIDEILTVIETSEKKDDTLFLSGWITKFGAKNKEIVVILRDMDTMAENPLATQERELKNDNVIKAGGDETKGGFSAQVLLNELQVNKCYEILMYISYVEGGILGTVTNAKVQSGSYLYNGEIYDYNPVQFMVPNFEDDELLQVVNEGILRAYDAREKIWIYEYCNRLYFIIEYEEGFLKENNVAFSVMFHTWQKELLSEEGKKVGFDHKGFYFEDSQYIREGILPYQVAVVPIEEEYQVSHIVTGLYSYKWIKEFNIYRVRELYKEDFLD